MKKVEPATTTTERPEADQIRDAIRHLEMIEKLLIVKAESEEHE